MLNETFLWFSNALYYFLFFPLLTSKAFDDIIPLIKQQSIQSIPDLSPETTKGGLLIFHRKSILDMMLMQLDLKMMDGLDPKSIFWSVKWETSLTQKNSSSSVSLLNFRLTE